MNRKEFDELIRAWLSFHDDELTDYLDDPDGYQELGFGSSLNANDWEGITERLTTLQAAIQDVPDAVLNNAPNARRHALGERVLEWRNFRPMSGERENWMSDILDDTKPEFRKPLRAAMLRWDEATTNQLDTVLEDILDSVFEGKK